MGTTDLLFFPLIIDQVLIEMYAYACGWLNDNNLVYFAAIHFCQLVWWWIKLDEMLDKQKKYSMEGGESFEYSFIREVGRFLWDVWWSRGFNVTKRSFRSLAGVKNDNCLAAQRRALKKQKYRTEVHLYDDIILPFLPNGWNLMYFQIIQKFVFYFHGKFCARLVTWANL